MNFSNLIINWYQVHKRDLPWRYTRNPYFIWLSEVILQQTRVKQGLPYFYKFASTYPTIDKLALAPEDEVLRLWQGLGYYSRARNMHYTAKIIYTEHAGKFPTTYHDLLQLKGIGTYTAAAIASFAFDEPVAVLDGNVFRVLARFFGVDADISSTQGVKIFRELSQSLLPSENSATYNQAIMEFGALQCTSQKPNCMFCPLQQECYAFRTGQQEGLPVKMKKAEVRDRFFNYYVLHYNNRIALRKRNQADIWAGLYDFYLVEADNKESFDSGPTEDSLLLSIADQAEIIHESKVYKHLLTHQRIFIRFLHLKIGLKEKSLPSYLQFFDYEQVEQLPKPILISNYLKQNVFNLISSHNQK